MNDLKSPVTLIGLGPMGQGMVRALLTGGHPVTVWNRTASRAAPLVAAGARLAASPTEAVASSDLIILSLTDYRAMYDILSTAESALAGRTIVNLSSDDPATTREAADWAAKHGATFIAGGVMSPAPTIGTEHAFVYYSGPKSDFDGHEPVLRLIGRSKYLGERVELAQVFYLANLDVFLTALSSVLHATALAESVGVKPSTILPDLIDTLTDTGAIATAGETPGANLDTGHHPGDQATATMMGASADHILSASRAAGIDTALPAAIKAHYDKVIAAGRGDQSWTAIFDLIKAER